MCKCSETPPKWGNGLVEVPLKGRAFLLEPVGEHTIPLVWKVKILEKWDLAATNSFILERVPLYYGKSMYSLNFSTNVKSKV